MKKIWILSTIGTVSGIMFCAYCASLRTAEADPLDTALTQSPSLATIHEELAAHTDDNPPMTIEQRQDLFAERFTERFRKHEPKMAVRARFEEINHVRNRIKLMCPARLEPWNMDRIAVSAWREAKECLGENYDIDLYETFIGSSPRKVGELRCKSGTKPIANIHYLPRPQYVNAAASVRRRAPARPVPNPSSERLSLSPAAIPGDTMHR